MEIKLIVGLGNPGEKYQNTRHNLGFVTLDQLLKKHESIDGTFWEKDKSGHNLIHAIKHEGGKILLAKPQTYMNNSGMGVTHLLSYYKILPEEMAVIYDDLDLPMGKLRIRFGGAAGGHHGVESIISSINSDKFLRIRLGIGHTDDEKMGKKARYSEDYVLSRFTGGEKRYVKESIKQVISAVDLILKHGADKYMSKYNK